MSRFVLRPAKILQTRLVVKKGEDPYEWDFQTLVRNLAGLDPLEGMKLARLRPGSFVGQVYSSRIPQKVIVFYLFNENRTGNIDFVLKADPSFEKRLICAFRVEEAEYDAKISETPSASAT